MKFREVFEGRMMTPEEMASLCDVLPDMEVTEVDALRILVGGLQAVSAERDALLQENRLLHDQLIDEVTGLHGRARFMEDVEKAHARFLRDPENHRYSVFIWDLDNLKSINDAHGHEAGDGYIGAAASGIRSELRAGDEAYRYGGDEFAALLEGSLTTKQARTFISRADDAMRYEFKKAGIIELAEAAEVDTPRASVGFARPRKSDRSPMTVVKRADAAMYEDKQSRMPEDTQAESNKITRAISLPWIGGTLTFKVDLESEEDQPIIKTE